MVTNNVIIILVSLINIIIIFNDRIISVISSFTNRSLLKYCIMENININ